MEDMIKALLDVVRAQHSAAAGTDEAPFNMDDIVDMAMNIVGRPDEAEEETEMVESIQKMVEEMAPDIFPPKTFEEQSDDEKVASAANMIQDRLMNSMRGSQNNQASREPEPYVPSYNMEEEEEEDGVTDPGQLNDLIYKNLMDMMGLQNPKVEYPFDRSQIQYGEQKSFTQQLQEEEEEKRRADREEAEKQKKLSAWELAQNIIDADDEKNQKEPYVPQVEEAPKGKSASQLAAEAIKASEERAKVQTEIERQAEAMMARARERGIDPMQFALHQQEILDYMEKNSDELVSFEDFEDLSPAEKYEIERQIQIEKEIASGISPEAAKGEVPKEFIPEGYQVPGSESSQAEAANDESVTAQPMFSEEMLRQLSQEVIKENSDMILAENENENMEDLNAAILENLMKMMSEGITPVQQENVDDLMNQVVREQTGQDNQEKEDKIEKTPEEAVPATNVAETAESAEEEDSAPRTMSAVELAMAAQKARQPVQKEETEGKSAVELAKEALARELEKSRNQEEEDDDIENLLDSASSEDLFDDLDDFDDESEGEEVSADNSEKSESAQETPEDEAGESDNDEDEALEDLDDSDEIEENEDSEEEEYEYVDPDEYVLGEHTQAEVDEAMENLQTLGLEGEVYERAKRMLLMELAGSEAELDAWLKEQENSKTKKAAKNSITDEELDDDFDDEELEAEFENAFDDDFDDEEDAADDPEEDIDADEEIEEAEDTAEAEDMAESAEVEAVEADVGKVEEVAEEVQPETVKEEIAADQAEETVEVIEAAPKKEEKSTRESRNIKTKRNVVKKKEKAVQSEAKENPAESSQAESKEYQVSVKTPFVLKNSASYMDKFTDYIQENQENRKLSTGFKKLDAMLRYGLHKGSYFIDASPMYLKNAFMQQIADRAAESGVDVLYISTELSRYELMTDTVSRLSYEMNGHNSEKAVSVMAIMTGEEGASIESLHDELNWYRGRISEHLYILDQEAVDEVIDSMEDAAPGDILAEIIRSIVREGAHKPVVFIDNIENIAFVEDAKEMEPLMQGIKALAKELSIPIVMSYGYAPAESDDEDIFVDKSFNRAIGNMCDVYMELQYAPMITEDGAELTVEDIQEMKEDGDSLLVDILLHRNRRNMRASCQIMATPKFNFFEE